MDGLQVVRTCNLLYISFAFVLINNRSLTEQKRSSSGPQVLSWCYNKSTFFFFKILFIYLRERVIEREHNPGEGEREREKQTPQ